MHTAVSITAHAHLSPEQIAAVIELAAAVRATGIDPRLNEEWIGARDGSRQADWLAWDGGRLVGIAATECFGETAEATIALLPDAPPETAAALYAALCRALPQQGATQLLVLHDRGATMLRALAEAHNLTFDHAEQLMRRPGELGEPPAPDGPIFVRTAAPEDLPLVAQVIAIDWGGNEAAALARLHEQNAQGFVFYLATLDGAPVASLNIQRIEGRPWIYGFSVLPQYRGRGFGRQILATALRETFASDPGDMFLEVDSENFPAINLYHSLGFAMVRTFDYWAKELPDGTYS